MLATAKRVALMPTAAFIDVAAYPGTTLADKFEAALADTNNLEGSTLWIRAGDFTWDKTVSMTKKFNVWMDPGNPIAVRLTSPDRYMLKVEVPSGANKDNRA